MKNKTVGNSKNKDSQSLRYQLTINNPLDNGLTHEAIKDNLIQNFSTLVYFCMADECGSCPHTHVYVSFSSRVRFSKVKKHFPSAHIEVAKGTVTDNVNYIKKSGKWENDQKHGTQIEGTFEEGGTRPPDSAGKNSDLSILYQMVLDGCTNIEIINFNQDYISMLTDMERLRMEVLKEKYKNERRLNLEVVYVSGKTGTGKTRGILDEYGDQNVYRVSNYQHPFDTYACQPVIMFDEFRSSLRLADMLQYLDIYPVDLPARYADKFACYTTAFVVSNWKLEEQYSDIQRCDRESWEAFLRRIKKVRVYTEIGKYTEYDSVYKYLSRTGGFHKVTSKEQKMIPFYQQSVFDGNIGNV